MTIDVAVIGYGYWGPNMTRNFAASSQATLRHICDFDESRQKLAAERYPATMVGGDFSAVLNDKNVEAVYIATPAATHYELTMAALRSGRHVLVEKPMALAADDCEKMIEEAAKRNLVLMVDYPFPYSGAVRKLRELCGKNTLGELLYFDSQRVNLGLFQSDTSVLWDLAPHDLSILTQVTNKRPCAVSAVGIAHFNGKPINTAYMNLFYEEAFMAHIHVSWLAPVKLRRTVIAGKKQMVIYDDTHPDEKVRVYDKGVEPAPNDARHLQISYRSGDLSVPKLENCEPLAELARHFLAVIRGEEKPLTNIATGTEVAHILTRAEESITRNGERLKL